MGGCAGLIVAKASQHSSKRRRLNSSEVAETKIPKRKRVHSVQATSPARSVASSETTCSPSDLNCSRSVSGSEHSATGTNIETLLREEGMLQQKNVPLEFLLDVLWETDEFRLSIRREIETVFPIDVESLTDDEPQNPAEAENRIFASARNAYDYLDTASKVISYFKSKEISTKEATDDANAMPEAGPQNAIFAEDETITIRALGHFQAVL